MTRALVVGSAGQDGRLLTERLRAEGAAVLGIERERVTCTEPFSADPIDVTDGEAVRAAVAAFRPERVVYLAAYHHSAEEKPPGDLDLFARSFAVHVRGLLCVLEAIRHEAPEARLFYAASSHVFGSPSSGPQTEDTPLAPACAYGVSKTAGVGCCRAYRRRGVYASVGFLYNHESPLRAPRFVSQKIVQGAIAASRDPNAELVLGDLSAAVDWGYAPDAVDAMLRILEQPESDDYVIATGETHTVGEFAELAFAKLGLDYRDHVREDRSLVSPQNRVLVGDATRLRQRTGWAPSVSFAEMVGRLVEAARG